MTGSNFKGGSAEGAAMGVLILIVLVLFGVLGWWMLSWTTHTLAWVAAFFGVVLGVGSRASK